MSKYGKIYLLIFVCIQHLIINTSTSPISDSRRFIRIPEENCPTHMELLQNEINFLKGKSKVHVNNMTAIEEEEYYHNKTCFYQYLGAIKSDNSIDLPSFLGFDPDDIAIWPAGSPILDFIIAFRSCFPIESHRTSTESVKKLFACVRANSELYQCPAGFEKMIFN